VLGFSQWLNRKLASNALHKEILAERSGLHVNPINRYLKAEYEPRMTNLIAIVTVIAELEDRSPTQMMFEAVTSLQEMKMVENRWRRKKARKPESPSQ